MAAGAEVAVAVEVAVEAGVAAEEVVAEVVVAGAAEVARPAANRDHRPLTRDGSPGCARFRRSSSS